LEAMYAQLLAEKEARIKLLEELNKKKG
jgi:hypothetical protein